MGYDLRFSKIKNYHERGIEIIWINIFFCLFFFGAKFNALDDLPLDNLAILVIIHICLNIYGCTYLKDKLEHPQKKLKRTKNPPLSFNQTYRKEDIQHNRGIRILIANTCLMFLFSVIWPIWIFDGLPIWLIKFIRIELLIFLSINSLGIFLLRKELLHPNKMTNKKNKSPSKKRMKKDFRASLIAEERRKNPEKFKYEKEEDRYQRHMFR